MRSHCSLLSETRKWYLAWLAALVGLLIFAVESACGIEGPTSEVRAAPLECIRGEEIVAHAEQLCDPAHRGRRAGWAGVKKSADYVARQFRQMGLRPGGSAGGFFQQFKILPGYHVSSELTVTLGRATLGEFKRGHDYTLAHTPGGEAAVDADIVLAGYGISLRAQGFDEYAGIDATGKVVIVFSGAPWSTGSYPWQETTDDVNTLATIGYKARNGAAHGAVCLLVVDNPVGWRKKLGIPQRLRLPEVEFPLNSPIPILHVTREFVAEITAMSMDELRMLASDIVRERAPNSMLLRGRRLHLCASVSGTAQLGRNIIGILPGRDDILRSEAVVLGAHYDHLGMAGQDIFFGANDNAAGVGALLTIAQTFAKMPERPRRTLIFVAFDAEEIGKRGSKHYVSRPCMPIEQTVLMINFDMIGRNAPDEINVVGTRSSPELHEIHQHLNESVGLRLHHPESFRLGRSDHTAFYYAGVPIMYLFGGLDPDYNTPRDTPDKLSVEKVERVARLAFLTAHSVAERPARISFTASAEPVYNWSD